MPNVQVVTGGTSGMGKATAKAISKYGPVIVGGRNEKRLAEAVEELRAAGVDAHGAKLDVSDIESVRAFADEALEIGLVGNVVHAAAVDMDNADTDTIARINVTGTVNVVETFFPLMAEGSSLLNFSSVTGYYYRATPEEMKLWSNPMAPDFEEQFKANLKGLGDAAGQLAPSAPAYFGSKAFVMWYTKANCQRFADRGCRIFSVAPGSFDTPMLQAQAENFDSIKQTTVFGRFGDPDEMAALCASLLSPDVAYLTGCDVLMDGGMFAKRVVPQLG